MDWELRGVMFRLFVAAIAAGFLLELAGCGDESVTVYSPGARVEAEIKGGMSGCVSVTVDNNKGPTLMLVPVPIPYTPVTAEKQP